MVSGPYHMYVSYNNVICSKICSRKTEESIFQNDFSIFLGMI